MTAITLANAPNQISLLEQHIAWAGLTLSAINPTLGILETESRNELVAQAMLFQAADASTRLLIRVSLPMDPAFKYDRTKKLWMFAEEISNTQIPAGFLAN